MSSSLLKKVESKNNNFHLNITPIKNETSTKYKNAFDILNNMNNQKYTMKYIEESRYKLKNNENDVIKNNINSCNNLNNSPINLNSNRHKNNHNRSTSCLNKTSIIKNEKLDKHKNRSMKKNDNDINLNIKEKGKKDNNNMHEYKINNLSSSYNNNFTNIKTNKIVFIDLKDNNNNFLKNNLNNESQNNNNLNLNSSRSGPIKKSNNINTNFQNKSSISNNKNNNNEEKTILRSIKKNKDDSNVINLNKNKFLGLSVQKLDQNKKDNIPDNFKIFEIEKRKEKKNGKFNQLKCEDLKKKKLSSKEISYYILSKSPILRLCERMIFSRSTQGLRDILSKEDIINDQESFMKNKIEELKEKIILCDKILETPFTASKTADITLNFITSLQESEFKDYPIILANDEEKKYYINYLKILYNLFQEEVDNKNTGDSNVDQNNIIINLRQNLYTKMKQKGFYSLRDYLYNVFITKKEYIKEIPKIAEINYLVSQVNNMFEIHNSLKICKFISFTLYLIKEIVKFGNNIKSSVELKLKAKNLIEIINKKLAKNNPKFKNK